MSLIKYFILIALCTNLAIAKDIDFTKSQNIKTSLTKVIETLKSSPYKIMHIGTKAGNYSGHFVKKTSETIILKNDPKVTHLKTKKSRIDYTIIDLSSIISLRFSVTQ